VVGKERGRRLNITTGEEQVIWRDLCAVLGGDDAADRAFVDLKADAKKLVVRLESLVPGFLAAYRAIQRSR